MKPDTLKCPNCKATARDNSKERGRFLRRHPRLCTPRLGLSKKLAEGIRSVDADVETDFEGARL